MVQLVGVGRPSAPVQAVVGASAATCHLFQNSASTRKKAKGKRPPSPGTFLIVHGNYNSCANDDDDGEGEEEEEVVAAQAENSRREGLASAVMTTLMMSMASAVTK